MIIPRRWCLLAVGTLTALALAVSSGCEQEAIDANRRQVEANQAQIEETQKELAALRTQNAAVPAPSPAASSTSPATSPTSPAAASSCDKGVMKVATRRGGDAHASGDLKRALGYYKDALTACPGNARAELNLASAYEAMGNRTEAIAHYRAAAASKDSDAKALQDARLALSRLGVSH